MLKYMTYQSVKCAKDYVFISALSDVFQGYFPKEKWVFLWFLCLFYRSCLKQTKVVLLNFPSHRMFILLPFQERGESTHCLLRYSEQIPKGPGLLREAPAIQMC